MVSDAMTPWIAAWVVMAAVVMFTHRKPRTTCGLVLGFTLQAFVLHWLAPTIYLLPWYSFFDVNVVFAGLIESTYAMAGFTIGTMAIGAFMSSRAPLEDDVEDVQLVDLFYLKTYAAFGLLFYMVLAPWFGKIPTISAVVTGGGNCIVLALALGCWNGFRGKQKGVLWLSLLGTALLPIVTLLNQGFLGFGAAAAAMVFAFIASFHRERLKIVACGLLVSYLGLSLYVTYMRDRNDIRDVVWGGEGASSRLSRVVQTFATTEAFDIHDVEHLRRIDMRLNQSFLVGASVTYLRDRPELFAGGETIFDAVLALFPRILWPDKPMVAGSSDLVSRFTGVRFAEGTAVGIGLVMELYVNFGTYGVFLGFIVMGIAIGYVDRTAAQYRNRGDWPGMVRWFLPGLSLFGLGGSLIEVSTGTASALVIAYLVNSFTARRHLARTQLQATTS